MPPRADANDEFSQFFLDLLDLCAVNPAARVPPGASEADLAALEAELEFPLPADLRTALLLSDGLEAPELAGPGSDAGLLSVAGIRERWRFVRGLDDSADRRLLPIADDNGVLRYLVLIPNSKHFGAVATWDSDGDAWGVVGGKPVPSLRALLEKALPKLQKKVPKGMPVIPGFARGAVPEPDDLAAIVTGLQTSVKKHKPVDDRLLLFARNEALLTAIVDALLRAGAPLLALAEHHEYVARVAGRVDAGLLLAALAKYEPVAAPHAPRLLLDWSGHLDDIAAALIARVPAEVDAVAGKFAPAVQLGLALVRVRLGPQARDTLPADLPRRLIRECEPPDHFVRPDGKGGVETLLRPEGVPPLVFALAPYFEDSAALAREVLAYALSEPPNASRVGFDPSRPITRATWLIAPALAVATPEQFAGLLQRVGFHETTLVDAAAPGQSALLAAAAAHLDAPARADDRAELLWAAYRVAARDGQPLPDRDDWLQPAHEGGHDPRVDPDRFAPVMVALGPERFERLLAGRPIVRWKYLQATPAAYQREIDAWVAARAERERPPAPAGVDSLAAALDHLAGQGPAGLPGLLQATGGPLRATLLRHAHRIARGGAAALAFALLEDGSDDPRARQLAGLGVARTLGASSPAVRQTFELGGGDVLALSRGDDGKLLIGRRDCSPVALDPGAHAHALIGPPGRQPGGLQRALPGGRSVGYRECELVFWDAAGRPGEARKTGYQKSYPQPEQLVVTPDGRTIVSATPDGGLRLHAVDGAGKPALLKAHAKAIYQLSLDRAGARLASVDNDSKAVVWDLAARRQLASFALRYPFACALTPSGARLVGQVGDELVLFDIASAAPVRRLPLKDTAWLGVCTGEDRFVCTDFVGNVYVVDFAAGSVARLHACGRRIFSILALDDDRVVVGGTAGLVRVLSTHEVVSEPVRPHAVIGLHVAPDGHTAAVWQQQALGNPPGWLMRDRPEPWQPVASAAELAVGAKPAAEQQGRVRHKNDQWVKYREQSGFIIVRHRPGHEPDEFIVTMGDACVNFWRGSDGELAARADLDGPLGGLHSCDDSVVVALDHAGLVWLDPSSLP
ncbi:SMI1/KNR4 family protein [Nannocystis pusilla]|uniref:SMI1/KNR4 family protein n=1 Tax=Nannocystis pusilla TaxID=889268 RepID=UPI003DA47935